ncbi:MAG: hypothetical protein AUG00_07905 [Candidatus Rokubacteria bacterium 13_1_20CM_2_70_7]|nr:MAG: hypothetical protein AUG00_07905 [Candidatus Rokubacteria bacterium 13_1_20CM_2_70_7]
MPCIFCDRVTGGDLLAENALAVACLDAFPLSPGHTLIGPRRYEPDLMALIPDEKTAICRLIDAVRDHIDARFHPDGYNLGVNVGAAGDQTVGSGEDPVRHPPSHSAASRSPLARIPASLAAKTSAAR